MTLIAPGSYPGTDRSPTVHRSNPYRAPIDPLVINSAQSNRPRNTTLHQLNFEIQAKSQKEASKRDYGCTLARDATRPWIPASLVNANGVLFPGWPLAHEFGSSTPNHSLRSITGPAINGPIKQNRSQPPNVRPPQPADIGFPTSTKRSRAAISKCGKPRGGLCTTSVQPATHKEKSTLYRICHAPTRSHAAKKYPC